MHFFGKFFLTGFISLSVYLLPAQQLNFAPLAETGTCLSGDCQTGTGTYRDANGNMYEGGFEEGKFNGKGKLTLASGDICEGWFLNGIENLSGSIREAESGDTIKTVFMGLKIPDGMVSVHQASGLIYHGSFKEDSYINGTLRCTNGGTSSILAFVKASKSTWTYLCSSSEKIAPTLVLSMVTAGEKQKAETEVKNSQAELKTAIHHLKETAQALLSTVDEINDKVLSGQTDLSEYQTSLNNHSQNYNTQTEDFNTKFGALFEKISLHRASFHEVVMGDRWEDIKNRAQVFSVFVQKSGALSQDGLNKLSMANTGFKAQKTKSAGDLDLLEQEIYLLLDNFLN
ncbi:MAG: hypothetical protein SF052_12535 [Bacteroidia bacterium]|nr:hypothetical protein [Bacteroidia bacterium]